MEICHAIQNRTLLSFDYRGHLSVVIPVAHGSHKTTHNQILRAYQIRGSRADGGVPGWGIYRIDWMSNIQSLPEVFAAAPQGYKRGDKDMSPIHCELYSP